MSRVLFCLLLALVVVAPGQLRTSTAIPLRLMVLNSADEAATVRAQLEKGVDFAVLAREKSVDATSVDGGLLGTVDPASLRLEIRAALRGLTPGQLSPVFKIPSGFAIVKVLAPGEVAGIAASERARQTALRAESGIRFDVNVSGFTEAVSALMNYAKPAHWDADPTVACAMQKQSFADLKARAAKLAATADGPGLSPSDAAALHLGVAQVYAYQGEMDPAIAQFEAALRIASAAAPQLVPDGEEMLGVAYFHRAEMVNDVYRPSRRALPVSHSSRIQIRQHRGFRKSHPALPRVPQARPGDHRHKWLLNLAYMTLGRYPAGVPKQYLLDASADLPPPRTSAALHDVAPQAGLDAINSPEPAA